MHKNLARLMDKIDIKNPLYFHMLALKNLKTKLRQQFHLQ